MDAANLSGALTALRDVLAALALKLDLEGAAAAREQRREVAAQVDDYLLPRVAQIDAPLLLVVGGSTGAGKSTLVNSLIGHEVTQAGVLRPTTRAPVLICNPLDRDWFAGDRVLGELARSTGGDAGPGTLTLVQSERLASGLALLDAPDIDSVVEANRSLSRQLLAAADAWLFVTTAARYADAVPWSLLASALERGTALSVVLDRVSDDAIVEVAAHLRSMLDERGLADARLLVVPEAELACDGLLPAGAVADVRGWFDSLAGDAAARADLVRRTLMGAIASLPDRVAVARTGAVAQRDAVALLSQQVDDAYTAARETVAAAVRDGTLLRGEVLARWHEVVGTGDLMRALEGGIGRFRDRIKNLILGRPESAGTKKLESAVEAGVEAVVRDSADAAADRVARNWRAQPAGKALLEEIPGAESAAPELPGAIAEEVRDWQRGVFELVSAESEGKRATARLASLGVNGAGLVVMIAVFASTGGLTGTEMVVAGGTSALSQKLLEAVFGDEAVRRLAARAQADLLERVDRLLVTDAARFEAVLQPFSELDPQIEALDAAMAELKAAAREAIS